MREEYMYMKYKVYIYGYGRKYDEIAPIIKAYEQTTLSVLGIITTDTPECQSFDGVPCYKALEIISEDYDYIIITPDSWKEIVLYLNSLGVSDDRIVLGSVFRLPYFSLVEYLNLKKRRPSILSSNCLAGMIYHMLGMPVNVPTYNCFCKTDTFYEFLMNIEACLDDTMEEYDTESLGMLNEATNDRFKYMPKGVLSNNKNIVWYFNHTNDISNSIEYWNKKRTLVNRDEIFALCYIKNEAQFEMFKKLNMNKVGFAIDNYDNENIIYIKEWKECLNIRRMSDFDWLIYIMNQMTAGREIQSKINWIRLLNGDKDYMRY